jgi:hypothetical protein
MPDDDLIAEMSEQDEMELVIATHESGHSVMAVALGLPLDHVQVGHDARYVLAPGSGAPPRLLADTHGRMCSPTSGVRLRTRRRH